MGEEEKEYVWLFVPSTFYKAKVLIHSKAYYKIQYSYYQRAPSYGE